MTRIRYEGSGARLQSQPCVATAPLGLRAAATAHYGRCQMRARQLFLDLRQNQPFVDQIILKLTFMNSPKNPAKAPVQLNARPLDSQPQLVAESRFASEADEQDAKNRRRHNRRTVVWKATIQVGAHKLPCWVRNISPFGALLQIDLPLAQSSSVVIEFDKIGAVSGFVAWSNSTLHGIAFMEAPELVAQRFGTEAERLGFFRALEAEPENAASSDENDSEDSE
jgi:hypothetical protein